MKLFWRIIRIPLAVIVLLLIGLTIYRIPFVLEQRKTQKAVEFIRAQRITLDDVNGKNLPPAPDPAKVDATVEGVDANGNGIRDDVELAIFKRYPNSARIRAAELQYAKALQLYLTEVFNSETLVATILKDEHGDFCISEAIRKDGLLNSKTFVKEVENLILNINKRKEKYNEVLHKYMTSYAGQPGPYCDINLDTL